MNENMLPVGTVLRAGTYRIEKQIGAGGFGNTYVVRHLLFNESRAMKEFFMKEINLRDGAEVTVSIPGKKSTFESQRKKFMKEAQRLRVLNNPHIVKVHDLFEENGTVYYVMDLIDGLSLADIVKKEGPLNEEKAMAIFYQILDTLKFIHSENPMMLHLDIKPSNIMLDKTGNAFLLDFGSSKQVDADSNMTSSAFTYTRGYAPSELIDNTPNRIGPWTDLYELGATLYNLLTGLQPPTFSEISEEGNEAFNFPKAVNAKTCGLILSLMATSRAKRPKSVNEVYGLLDVQSEPDEEVDDDETIINEEDDDETILGSSNNETDDEEETVIGNVNSGSTLGKISPKPNPTPEPIIPHNSSKNNNLLYAVLGIIAVIVLWVGVKSLFSGKSSESSKGDTEIVELTDTKRIPAQELEERLFTLQKKGYMIGHEDDPLYGIGWSLESGKSDLLATVGDYPAIMGFRYDPYGDIPLSNIRDEIIAHNKRGGIVSLIWNPVDYREVTTEKLHGELDEFANFIKTLKTDDGELIPIIFRPWSTESLGYDYWDIRHMNENSVFIKMWNTCQDYINEKGLNNLLWCYSVPVWGIDSFEERYPGNDRVMMIGIDCYFQNSESKLIEWITPALETISKFSQKNNIMFAFTECSLGNKGAMSDYWTRVLMPVLDKYLHSMSFFMIQANDGYGYPVAPSSRSSSDFKKFYAAENTLFLNDIKDIQ